MLDFDDDDLPELQADADGRITFWPVTGWRLGTPARIMVGAQLIFAKSPRALVRKDLESVQLGMTAAQARELGHALLRKADELEDHSSETPN